MTRVSRKPFQFASSAVAVPIGIAALALGSQVSVAMSRVLEGQVDVVRLWGALVLLGGVLTTAGRFGRPGLERAGLLVLGPAWALYAASVLLGLGVGGLVAGPMFLALAAACVVRARAGIREQAAALAAVELLDPPT